MADQTEDWLSLAREAFSSSDTYFNASIRRQIESDLRQFQGLHPASSKYLAESNKSRSRLFRPKTRATIRKNEAIAAEAFFSTKDVVSIEAEDDEDEQQQASAAIMLELLQYRLTKSIPWFLTLVGAYQDALSVGVVASYQSWLYNEQKGVDRPDVRLVPIENLRFDPAADWTDPVNTSPYVIEMIPMYVKDVRARMKTPDPRTNEPKWKPLDEQAILAAVKNYSDTIRLVRENGRTDSKEQQSAVSAFSVVWVHKNIIEKDGVDYVYYTLGSEQLLSDPKPLDDVYYHGIRPYVVGSAIVETHKTYPSSLAKLGRDVQAEINEVANLRIDNIKFALNKRYFVKRNSQVDLRSLTRNVPGSVTLMNTLEDVKAQEFGDVTGSSYQEQDRLNLDFDEITGNFSNASVQSNRQLNETVGGMNILTTDANQVSGYQLRTFVETWVEPVLRQLVLLEQYYETDETVMALAGKKANLFQRFKVDAVTDDLLMRELTVNVNVGMGATNPTEKVNRFLMAMNSLRTILADGMLLQYGLDVEEVIKELFGNLGYRDGGRFFKTGDQDPRIASMQKMIEQLQQELKQKHDPELIAAQIRKIDAEVASLTVRDKKDNALAVKTMVEAEFSAMQGAEVVAAVPQTAPIADALMQAAGYQAPTPAGDNPNFPTAAGPAPGLAVQPINNHRIGTSFTPSGGQPAADPSTTVNAMPPAKPATPGMGERHGIETLRPDSAPHFANGGMISDEIDPETGLTHTQSLGINAMTEQAAQGKIGNSIKLPAGLSPEQQGSQMMDMFNAAPSGTDPAKLNALRDAASRTANPGYQDTDAFGSPLTMFGGNGGILSHFANGGLITGPGTGTSDSIPAVNVDTGEPMKVSNGEVYIPPEVVQAVGKDFFERLIEQFHSEAPQGNDAPPADTSPLFMENGGMIIPADVVAHLGAGFFQALIKAYSA